MDIGGQLDPAPWARAWERIDTDFDGHLEEIRRFLRRPTVSASDDDMLAGAEHVAAMIEGAGGSAEIVATAGHPAVLGRIEGDGPRLMRYGMYDVQPADEPGWSSPPFAAVTAEVPEAGPSVVARGAANSKGALAAFLPPTTWPSPGRSPTASPSCTSARSSSWDRRRRCSPNPSTPTRVPCSP